MVNEGWSTRQWTRPGAADAAGGDGGELGAACGEQTGGISGARGAAMSLVGGRH